MIGVSALVWFIFMRRMVTRFGMSDALGTIYLGRDQEALVGREFGHTREYSGEVARQIDIEDRRLLNECYEKARTVLRGSIGKRHTVDRCQKACITPRIKTGG